MMTLEEFGNGLRLLRSIDSVEIGDPEWWDRFRDDPSGFFTRCDDQRAQVIWAAMVRRIAQQKRPEKLELGDGAIGWAVTDNGGIKVRTVSDTRRAAVVNWLVTERGAFITKDMTDEQIERLWFHRKVGVEVEYVTINRTHGEAPHG